MAGETHSLDLSSLKLDIRVVVLVDAFNSDVHFVFAASIAD